jgi:tRNA nucleotidyltransferase (CCA-adding enzyme)
MLDGGKGAMHSRAVAAAQGLIMNATLPHVLRRAAVPAGVRALLERLQTSGYEAWLVGGDVRDLLRDCTPKDWDVATQALPEQVVGLFKRVVPTGIAHGTVTVLIPEGSVEVTTYRVERAYLDGRRPSSVEFRRDLEEDLARRDFTINAIAFDPIAGRIKDPFGGQEDLARRTVRCVGTPAERFGEDGLRPLRAVRFATVLDFELDAPTAQAIPGALPVFRKVAQERVRDEFLKLLLAPGVARGLSLLRQTGLLSVMLPELDSSEDGPRTERVARAEPSLEVRLAALLIGNAEAEAALARLRLPARLVETVRQLLAFALEPEAEHWSDAEARRWLVRLGPERAEPALALARARGVDVRGDLTRRVQRVLAAHPPLSVRELALDGSELMRLLGVGPSPAVGEATRFLFEAVLEDPSRNTPETLERLLRERFPGQQP